MGQARVLHHARTRQQHRKTARRADDGLFQFCLAGKHIVQRDLGRQVQHHVKIRQAEVSIHHENPVPAFGQGAGQIGRHKSLAHTAFAAGHSQHLAVGLQRQRHLRQGVLGGC